MIRQKKNLNKYKRKIKVNGSDAMLHKYYYLLAYYYLINVRINSKVRRCLHIIM